MRVLIVSTNSSLIFNIKEWFERDIASGNLEIDIAQDRATAEKKLKKNAYDKIFHNGIFIIDAIEQYQSNTDVIHYGRSKNNIYSSNVDENDKKQMSAVLKKPLYFGVNIKGIVSALATLITMVYAVSVFATTLRSDVDHNTVKLNKIENVTTSIEKTQTGIHSSIEKLNSKIDEYFQNKSKDNVGDKK